MNRALIFHSRTGMTLLEVMIVVALLGMVGGSITVFSKSSSGAFTTSNASLEVESRGRRVVSQIKELVRASGISEITPTPAEPDFTTTIDFRRAEGEVAEVITWGDLERFSIQMMPGEADDGLDNNGNGVIDEGRLIWTQDVGGSAKQVVLCNRVAEFLEGEIDNGLDDNGNGLDDEPGFCLTFNGESVTIRLSLEEVDSIGVRYLRTYESTVTARN